jgi:Flp pilus assembly protein TadG
MVETAICAPVFFLLLFFVFELAYDAFLQAALEATLATTAQQIETGDTTAATAANFISSYACKNTLGLLNCNKLYMRVETFSPSAGTCTDYYAATTGLPPVSGNAVELSDYVGTSAGSGGNIGSTSCSTSGTTAFCDPLPQQKIILSAVYLAPSFLGGLLPIAAYSYTDGHRYHVAFATVGFETENFGIIGTEPAPCPASA